MPDPSEEQLPEAPGDENAEAVDVEQLTEETRADEESYARAYEAISAAVTASMSGLEPALTNMPSINDAAGSLPVVASEALSDPTPDARLTALESNATAAIAETAKAPDKDKQWTTSQYLGLVFGVGVTTVAVVLLFEHLARKATDQPSSDLPPLPPDTDDTLTKLLDSWKAFDDATFWRTLASYVAGHPGAFTGAQQIVFMNLTIELCPVAGFFLWDSAGDKADAAEALVRAYHTNSDTADMYRQAAAYVYHQAPLPRAVTADVLRLALSWVFHVSPTRRGADLSSQIGLG